MVERCCKSEAGYSLTEMMIVVGITAVLGGMAVFQVGMMRGALRGDSGMRVLLAQMNQAREQAITQRRNMWMVFDKGNHVEIKRENASGTPAFTSLSSTFFEGKVQYAKLVSDDTPDKFTNSDTGGINLPTAVPPVAGDPPEVKFTPEGKFVNQNGASLNATILVGLPSDPLSQRAVTIMGSTGRIRAFRWNGKVWVLV